MKFKLSLIYTALFAGVSVSFVANVNAKEHSTNEHTLEGIDVITKLVNEKGYKAERTEITGVNSSIIDTPYSIDIVTQEQLQDKQPSTLEDAVKGISGLSQGNNLAGTLDTVKRRGYGGNRDGSIMRNGLASPLARNFNANVERVEVLKGPASVLYGMQNPGGVINVVTKKPSYENHKTTLDTSYGSNYSRNFGIDVTGPIAGTGFAYRIVADHKKKHSWRNFGENKETIIAPSLSWKNDSTKLTLSYEYQDYKGDFDRGIFIDTNKKIGLNNNPNYGKPLDIPLERRLDDPINVTTGYSHTIQFNAEHKLNPNWTLKADYGYAKNHYSDWQARITKYDAKTRKVTRRIDSTNPSDAVNNSLNLSAIGIIEQSPSVTHQLRTAVELQKYQLTIGDLRRSGTHAMSIDTPEYNSTQVINGQASSKADVRTSDMLEQYKTLGLVVQDAIYLGDKWIVSGGVRAQWHQIKSGQGRENQKFRNNDSGFALLPQLGLVHLITPDWSIYGNVGTSAKPNPSRSWDYKGEKIKLETSRQFEIGTKYNNEWLSANLALFHIIKDNTAKRYKDPATNENVIKIAGKDRSQGIEIDINGKLTDKLTISANYTYTKTKVLRDDAEPQNIGTDFDSTPRHLAGLTLIYDWGHFLGGHWRTGAGAEYQGSWGFNYINNDQATWFKIPSATLYNAFISYDVKLGKQDLNLRLTGKNLTNKRYFVSHTTATMEHLSIGSPREVVLSAKFSF